uniref:Nuclear receptor domain-containing protein n=1 Tax=Meloidogyne enterolobii TaxID=390850 RepID=A0A6V7XDJ2_MELEN|nr:unnamed protein product [Meloidogyne enterolobii]
MDLQQQQQMFLNAWIRPTLLSPTSTNTTTIINSQQQQQNILQNIPEHLRGNSSSSSLIIRPPQQPQQHQQQLVIRHVPPSIRVFEPSMSSPLTTTTSSSSSSSSIPFSSSPSLNNSNNLNPLLLLPQQQQYPISSPISTKILQIPLQQPQQYPPQQFDQLVALAHFQQMLERIKASETAKASQLLENNSQNFGLIPTSAFKLVNNSIQNSELTTINKTSSPYFLSEESVLQQRQLEPKQQKIELKPQQQTSQQQQKQQQQRSPSLQKNFTPKPSTSADELLGQALIKLLQQQQTKGEITEINGNNNAQTNIEGNNTNQANPDYSTIIAGEEILLCKVCSDRASGFHYGIFSCEGCKGFFRRSLQNKIDYRPCTQSQKCQIVRANRNRCQECRWRKCIEAGMSKDGVRYGRVPKREKEKLREEMRRDSVRSVFEHLNFELSNEERLLEKLEKGWKELENDLRIILKRKEEENNVEEEKIIDSNKLCLLAKAVVRFAENIGGFRLLRIDDQAQVLKESLYPVLLLRFCSLRLFPNNDRLFDLANIPLALLLPTSSFSALRDCTVELIIRIRAARRPTDLPLSDQQLAICAAVCLCRLEGAGECASGGATSTASFNGMTANTFINAWDEQSDQLGQATTTTPNTCSVAQCGFGPTPLRTDLLDRQNLASLFESLKKCKELYSHFLNANICKNIPFELFSPKINLIENNRKRKILENEEENNKKEFLLKNKILSPEINKKEEEIIKINNNQQQQINKKLDMPILRQVLEQQQQIIPSPTINNNLNNGLSLRERHKEMALLLERPPLISILDEKEEEEGKEDLVIVVEEEEKNKNNVEEDKEEEEEEQPLNLCLRDGAN